MTWLHSFEDPSVFFSYSFVDILVLICIIWADQMKETYTSIIFCPRKGSKGEESSIWRSFNPWNLGLPGIFKSFMFPSISQVSKK